MATSLLALLDDIATVLDDVALLTKVASKKTAGVLGDDLALNAQQVTGVKADRELPVVWAVAKGSALNKVILVPAALGISAVIPWAVTPLLMFGGLFLCYEGFEKIAHKFLHKKEEDDSAHQELVKAVADDKVDLVAFEKQKIKGAVRTDFILSAEIIAITLGTVTDVSFGLRFGTLAAVAALMTVGVYGFVAAIVKLDDLGLYLSLRDGGAVKGLGRAILWTAPKLMKLLSVAGTAAMFLVGGGILVHGLPGIEPIIHHAAEALGSVGALVVPSLGNALVGIISGGIAVAVVSAATKAWGGLKTKRAESSASPKTKDDVD